MRFAREWTIGLLIATSLVSCGGTFEVGILNATETQTSTEAAGSASATGNETATDIAITQTVTFTAQPSLTLAQLSTSSRSGTPQPATPTATPCTAPAKWATYIVKSGDTLFDLSQQTNTGVQQIRQANCLASDIIRTGQQIYLPYIPTPTFTPTPTSTPTPPLPTMDPGALFSPNGSLYATNAGAVVDTVQRRVATDILSPLSLTAWRWTTDSRFVIFGRKNQFNSTYTYIFDTVSWKLVYSTNGCTIQSNNTALTDNCGDYPFALEANTNRLLLENGVLIDLRSLQALDLLADERPAQLSLLVGSWSPGESFLAWVTTDASQSQYAVYLAGGDGSQSRLITVLDSQPISLQWLSATTAKVTTTGGIYVVDAASGVVAVTPTVTVTLSPSGSPTP